MWGGIVLPGDKLPFEGDDKKEIFADALFHARPNSLKDSAFIKNLVDVGYHKRLIDEKYFPQLDTILKEKLNHGGTRCIRAYRDILVFKRDSKIIGIANICVSCGDSNFHDSIGTSWYLVRDRDDLKDFFKLIRSEVDDATELKTEK